MIKKIPFEPLAPVLIRRAQGADIDGRDGAQNQSGSHRM